MIDEYSSHHISSLVEPSYQLYGPSADKSIAIQGFGDINGLINQFNSQVQIKDENPI